VDDATDVRHVRVDVSVRERVRRRRTITFDERAVQIGDHHRLGCELVVGDTGRLDDEQVGARHTGGHVARGPGDEVVRREKGVQRRDLRLQAVDLGP